MAYYLMIKEAVDLDLKYLCKCIDTKDHISYRGSGVHWRKSIDQYTGEIKTTVLGLYPDQDSLRKAGLFYSHQFNVVDDLKWANLIPEAGDGGSTVQGKVRAYNPITKRGKTFASEDAIPVGWIRGCVKGHTKPPHAVEASRQSHIGRKRSDETRRRMCESIRKPRLTNQCQRCSKSITTQNMQRHMNSKRCQNG